MGRRVRHGRLSGFPGRSAAAAAQAARCPSPARRRAVDGSSRTGRVEMGAHLLANTQRLRTCRLYRIRGRRAAGSRSLSVLVAGCAFDELVELAVRRPEVGVALAGVLRAAGTPVGPEAEG